MSTGLDEVLSRIQQIQQVLAPVVGATSGDQFATVLDSQSADSSGSAGTVTADGTSAAAGTDPAVTPTPSDGASIVADANKYLGVPYVWGGTDPSTGLDCSGLVQRVFADLGTSVPRTSQEQATVGTPVASVGDAQPGDLVFYAGSDGTASAPGHVGIYIGNGQMIDAPYTGANVRVDPVGTPVAIRRVVLQPAAVSSASLSAAGTGRPADLAISAYTSDFVTSGAAHGVPANLLAAVARTESGLNPKATSPAGAEGLMQLMPGTAAGLGVNPWDPASAIDGAARLLSSDYQRFGSWSLALAAYNAGAGAVASYGGIPPYPETENYVTKVLATAGMSS